MAEESAAQKKLRRGVNSQITEILNTITLCGKRIDPNQNIPQQSEQVGAMIRRCVLLSLRNIDDRIRMLERDVQQEFNFSQNVGELVKFYMKGGNAYKCVVGNQNDIRNARQVNGGGTSDWDTQVVVNPWLPIAVRKRLYNEIEEVTLSEFRTCARDIAGILHNNNLSLILSLYDGSLMTVVDDQDETDDVPAGQYIFVPDEKQSTRRIFNYDSLGMVFDDRVFLPADNKDGPGLLFHDAIRPFRLFRLGYIGKVYRLRNDINGQPLPANPFEIDDSLYELDSILPRKSLAELIDITIPRQDTIESFEVWESLRTNHIQITHEELNVANLEDASQLIPLPDINYHKLEQFLMLCEMADGSSRHYNKLPRRVDRLAEICQLQAVNDQRDVVIRPLLHMAGVNAEQHLQTNQQAEGEIDNYLRTYDTVRFNNQGYAPNPNGWLPLIRCLMIHIRVRANNNNNSIINLNWQAAENAIQRNNNNNRIRGIWAAIYNNCASPNNRTPSSPTNNTPVFMQRYRSDDLAMLDRLRGISAGTQDVNPTPLVNAENLKPSTISHWRIYRFYDKESMLAIFAEFENQIRTLNRREEEYSFNYRFYTRIDGRGHIPECIIVSKEGEEIKSVCTLTVGDDARTGGVRANHTDRVLDKNTLATLSDMAMQRKLTASLIHDYPLKTSISSHYVTLQALINSDME